MDDVHPLIKVIAVTSLAGLIMITIVLAITYRKEDTIVIESRWWSSTTAVKYNETRLETECGPESVCTGYGEDRSCTTQTVCNQVLKTYTYTRCSDSVSGHELPVVYPGTPCHMWPGDYVRHTSSFIIAYHRQEEDKPRLSPFLAHLWEDLNPKETVGIKKNILGYIVEAN